MMPALLLAFWFAVLPEAEDPRFAQAAELLESWNVGEAAGRIEQLSREFGEDPEILALLMRLEFYRGNYQKALGHLGRIRDSGYTGAVPEEQHLRAAAKIAKGFAEERSDHFLFRYLPGKSEVLAPYAIEALEAAYQRLGADLGVRPSKAVPVEVYGSVAELASATGLSEKEIKDSGTIAVCKFGRIMLVTPAATAMGYTWLDTLSHEFAHFLITMRSRNRAPIWVQEAVAKFEENRWRSDAPGEMTPGAKALLRKAVEKGALISFEKMHPSFAKLPSQDDTALAFAEVEAAASLVFEIGGYKAIGAMLDGLAKGLDDRNAVELATGLGFDAFIARWKKHMAKIASPAQQADYDEKIRFVEGSKPSDEESPFKPKSEKANRFVRLGEILRERGRMKAAATEFRKALKEFEKTASVISPYLRNKLARCLMADPSGYREAEQLLSKAIEAAPAYPSLHKTLGTIHMQQQLWDKAMREFTGVIRINPFDIEAHAALAEIHSKLGNKEAKDLEARNFKVLRDVQDADLQSVARLIATEDGFLNVNSRPWAEVFIDGEYIKKVTPLIMYPLKAGSHTVTLQQGPLRKDIQVEIKAGEALSLFEKLEQ